MIKFNSYFPGWVLERSKAEGHPRISFTQIIPNSLLEQKVETRF